MNTKLRFNKILERSFGWQFVLFSLFNAFVFALCLFVYFLAGKPQELSTWQTLRLFLDSNSVIDGKEFENNYILLITECLGTILFSGLIVSIITNIISQKVVSIKEGHVHYKLRNHVVVIGFDTVVPSIVYEIMRSKEYAECSIVIQTSNSIDDNDQKYYTIDDVRHLLLAKLTQKEMKRIVLIHAPRQSEDELERLYTVNAKEIHIVGDRALSDHDAENMHTFEKLVKIHEREKCDKQKPLTVWFENESSYAALQLNDISNEWKKYFNFKPYNFYKRWANRLLTNSSYEIEGNKITYPELDHRGITAQSNKNVHLIIVGMNRMGIALAKETAHLMHFPNFNEHAKEDTAEKNLCRRTRITFIDDHADIEKDFFIGRLPGYFKIAPLCYADMTSGENAITEKYLGESKEKTFDHNFLDIQFEFIKGRIESHQLRKWLRKEMMNENEIITIAVCLHDPSKSLGVAMYLPDEVYKRGREDASSPWEVKDESRIVNIFVRQEKTGALIKTFGDAANSTNSNNKQYANLYPFGMVDESFSLAYHSTNLAMAFNYIYDFYNNHSNMLPGSIPSTESLKKTWENLPIALQWSNLYLADSVEFKLRSIGLNEQTVKTATISADDIKNLACTEHNRWNMEKLLLGYRPLTKEEKELSSAETKKLKNTFFAHHLIAPYDKLSNDNKALDLNVIVKLPDIIRMLN